MLCNVYEDKCLYLYKKEIAVLEYFVKKETEIKKLSRRNILKK